VASGYQWNRTRMALTVTPTSSHTCSRDVEMVSLGAHTTNVYCFVSPSRYSTVHGLESWRGGKTYMQTRGWIMNYATVLLTLTGLPRAPGWSTETKKHHVKVDCTSILIS